MKYAIIAIVLLICAAFALSACRKKDTGETKPTISGLDASGQSTLLYQGHGSLRITTRDGKVIYVDPYAGSDKGYKKPADLILVTHGHPDHNNIDKVESRNPDCRVITWKDALKGGVHQTFELDYVTVEAVEAGYNPNHNVKECVGYILTLPEGVTVYVCGDTSRTKQMPDLAQRHLDYAFFCCDGKYNMDVEEAAQCAVLVGARHNVPYHMAPGALFDKTRAEQFQAPNRLIIADGQEIPLVKE
ncbi:MAG: MBL fold metallo-hydrolase [Abditibacteriota bacterium]|nr:MBL fold metallo-hydrolase [Abditibacteriota bacterium]